ncbi:MAG: SPASM domain-containing protein [Candidatus Aminicenantes bacterium]
MLQHVQKRINEHENETMKQFKRMWVLIREFGWGNIFRVFKDSLISVFKYNIIGSTVRLEASTLCQLRCQVCPLAQGKTGILGKGYLRYSDFRRFVHENPRIRNIELSNYGEIFLNPELMDIITYAHSKHINLTALNGVNFNSVSENILEALVRFRFKAIYISIDGASNDTYRIYRCGGDFDTVLYNIKRINYFKQKYGRHFPYLVWQFVVFGHNEHELPIAKKMAKDLNMGFVVKLNWNKSYSPVRDKDLVRRETGYATQDDYERKHKRLYMSHCYQLWNSPQINWDGKLLGCCVNRKKDFGNVFEKSLENCLKSEKYIYAKNMLMGKVKPREDIPCFDCPYFERIRSKKFNPVFGTLRRLKNVLLGDEAA